MSSKGLKVISVLFAFIAFFDFFTAAVGAFGAFSVVYVALGAYFCMRSVQTWKQARELESENG